MVRNIVSCINWYVYVFLWSKFNSLLFIWNIIKILVVIIIFLEIRIIVLENNNKEKKWLLREIL